MQYHQFSGKSNKSSETENANERKRSQNIWMEIFFDEASTDNCHGSTPEHHHDQKQPPTYWEPNSFVISSQNLKFQTQLDKLSVECLLKIEFCHNNPTCYAHKGIEESQLLSLLDQTARKT